MTEKFYLVWNFRGRTPTHQHPNREAAQKEALRLFAQSPDDTFFVLETVCEIAPAIPPVRITDMTSGDEQILAPAP